jgi:hypothetical protein
VRNSVFNIPVRGVPMARRLNSSAASLNKYQGVNQTVYSYGAQHTNIRENLLKTTLVSSKMRDVQMQSISPMKQMNLEPRAIMNDYTKNISSSVWSPGLYINDNKLRTINSKYGKTPGKVKSKFEDAKYLEQHVQGLHGRVEGKIGEKFLTIQSDPRRVARPKTADMTKKEKVRILKKQIRTQSQVRQALERDVRSLKE